MIRLALAMGWAMTAGGRVGNLIRRAIVPRLRVIPGMRCRIVNSTTPALHRSALVAKPPLISRPRQLAGTLCPNPLLESKQRLDAVAGPGFALVSTTPLTPSQRTQLDARGAVAITATPGSELAQWLRRGGAGAAIIRPDRTVMQTGRTVSALCDSVPTFRLSAAAAQPNTHYSKTR
jgi:3-(3-hydroxy-phenyl)propionate hydroxylase